MSAPRQRRNNAVQPALTPDFSAAPAKVIRSDDATQITWWKRLLYNERKRHGQLETVLARHIASLENQISDLRTLYLSTIKFPIEGAK